MISREVGAMLVYSLFRALHVVRTCWSYTVSGSLKSTKGIDTHACADNTLMKKTQLLLSDVERNVVERLTAGRHLTCRDALRHYACEHSDSGIVHRVLCSIGVK